MAKFHIAKSGEPAACKAEAKACALGAETPHGEFESATDALAWAENYHMKQANGNFPPPKTKPSKTVNTQDSHTAILEENELNELALEKSNAELKLVEDRFKKTAAGDDPQATEEALEEFRRAALQNGVLARRKYLLNSKKAALGLAEAEELPKVMSEYPYKFDRKTYYPTTWGKMEFHYELPERIKGLLAKELSAFSDYSFAEAYEKVNSYSAYEETEKAAGRKPLDRDSYIVSLFQEGARNQTRDRVFVDIETTGFDPRFSEIIEVGIVRVSPDGEVTTCYDERFDLESPEFRDVRGVGPTEVHKITPADIAGKPKFSDPEVQRAVGKLLNDPEVIVGAHNDTFEKKYFNLHLKGFWARHSQATEAQRESNRSMQDTMLISSFLEHSTENNRLQSFAEGNGVPYENAHSALADAKMSALAYANFRKKLMALPLGERPTKATKKKTASEAL